MDKLKFLKKLIEEGKAVAPIIKEAGQGAGAFAKEAQMAEGQKVVQKLMTGEEYAKKMARLRNTAGVAGVVGAGMLMPQDEAAAAGLDTIARKLGVGLEEAAKIKKLAQTATSPGAFEENIRAIKTVAEYKRNPEAFKKIGSGVDFRALDAGDGKVLKAPKDLTEDTDMFRVAPALVEQAGMGPKTKTIQAGDKSYMIQDRVNPLDEIVKSAQRPGGDAELDKLYKMKDKFEVGVPEEEFQKNLVSPEYQKILSDIDQRSNAILKAKGIDTNALGQEISSLPENQRMFIKNNTPEGIRENPEETFEDLIGLRARQKLSDVVNPVDLHSGNIGLDNAGNPTIFDNSRFRNFKPDKLNDVQRQAIMDANIALPEKKSALERLLYPDVKKVAAVAPITTPNELITRPAGQLAETWQAIRQPINNATRKAGEYISDMVTPPGMIPKEARDNQREMMGTIGQMAFDPANLLAPGAGLAVGAADIAADQLAPQPTPEEEQYAKLKGMMGRP